MAYKNKIINNPVTGQSIRFLQTNKDTSGALLEMEATYNGNSKEPTPHYHPFQKEDFKVLEGEISVRLNGEVQILKAGDTFHIPAGTAHSMWNHSAGKAVINWQMRPAMTMENLLETTTGLAADGKTNQEGMPNILQVALTAKKYSNVLRLAKPPFPLQRITFAILSPFAYLFGYKPTYKKYFV